MRIQCNESVLLWNEPPKETSQQTTCSQLLSCSYSGGPIMWPLCWATSPPPSLLIRLPSHSLAMTFSTTTVSHLSYSLWIMWPQRLGNKGDHMTGWNHCIAATVCSTQDPWLSVNCWRCWAVSTCSPLLTALCSKHSPAWSRLSTSTLCLTRVCAMPSIRLCRARSKGKSSLESTSFSFAGS